MKLLLIQWYNEPNDTLRLPVSFRELLIGAVDEILLAEPCFKSLKADFLEILVCTHRGPFEVKPQAAGGKKKYHSVQVWMPYGEITAARDGYLSAFTRYFFMALAEITAPLGLPKEKSEKAQALILQKLQSKPDDFTYILSADEMWIEGLKAGV